MGTYGVSFGIVMAHPVLPRTACFSHPDGTIHKTDKAALCKLLEQKAPTASCFSSENVLIIDGFAMLYRLKQIPTTFGDISKLILKTALYRKSATRVDIVFDRYESPSIKDYEHRLRKSYDEPFKIVNRQQVRQSTFTEDLKNIKFKQALVEFIIQDWRQPDRFDIIQNRTVYVNYEKCYKYTASEGMVNCEECDDLTTNQLEADTKIVLHACSIYELCDENKPRSVRILIDAADTDILIIMLANMKNLANYSNEIWMRAGAGRTRRNINISEMYQKLTPEVCQALPAIHAFSGCDFNPCFYRIGKKNRSNLRAAHPYF